MRLFVSIKIPGGVSSKLDEIKSELEQEGVKITVDNHITLKFLGDVEDKQATKIQSDLKEVKFDSFELTINKITLFPNERYIRLVYADIEENEEMNKLLSLYTKIHTATKYIKHDKGFLQHITLARVRFLKQKERFIEEVKNIKLGPTKFKVDKFHLVKSTLTSDGPVYEDLGEYNSGY